MQVTGVLLERAGNVGLMDDEPRDAEQSTDPRTAPVMWMQLAIAFALIALLVLRFGYVLAS